MTSERLATYWDALCDMRLDAVLFACQHATRHWTPRNNERFPYPAVLREYAREYQAEKAQRAADLARKQLAQWSETPDEEGLQAIRDVLKLLGQGMDLTNKDPVYLYPSKEDPEERKAKLLEQVRQELAKQNNWKE